MKKLTDERRMPSDGNTSHGPLGQDVKINLAYNFKVNLITHLEVIALFSSNFKNVNTCHPLFQKL
jgi:hypothetical protein